MAYYSTRQAAARLGCSARTISRASKKAGVGIYLVGGRLAALALNDLSVIRKLIHETSGNPNWIAAAKHGRKMKAS